MEICAPVYVDDILGIGNTDTVEKVIRNTRQMEVEKKFKFSRKKSMYMMVNSGKDQYREISGTIQDGAIERTKEYKYLGWWFNEENNASRQLQELDGKVDYMIREIKIAGNKHRVGMKDADVQRMLYGKIVVPTLTYNMEVTTNMSEKEYGQLEKIQGRALRQLMNLPPSTPYWGLLIELGIKPLEYEVHYKRLMLYHNIMNSDDARIAKQVICQQRKFATPIGFYQEIIKSAKFYNISEETILKKRVKKSEWKQVIKLQMVKKLDEEATRKTDAMSKLRYLRGSTFRERDYVGKCNMEELTQLLKLRLNMIPLECNYGKKSKCKMCEDEMETTEHMLMCKITQQKVGYSVKGRLTSECKGELSEISKYQQRVIQEIKEQMDSGGMESCSVVNQTSVRK